MWPARAGSQGQRSLSQTLTPYKTAFQGPPAPERRCCPPRPPACPPRPCLPYKARPPLGGVALLLIFPGCQGGREPAARICGQLGDERLAYPQAPRPPGARAAAEQQRCPIAIATWPGHTRGSTDEPGSASTATAVKDQFPERLPRYGARRAGGGFRMRGLGRPGGSGGSPPGSAWSERLPRYGARRAGGGFRMRGLGRPGGSGGSPPGSAQPTPAAG
jgi:translation initiation factor IF-2